ncbi:RnfABCDGE type electron transport complex subunit G [Dorea longicatena]|uniref:RnfABCDGE type electron transport complex subunit G n=1 Tax=Dorea longicatena TaxID=88431 RepID=UPI0030593F54|nr:RnfABCDGE type electron transport complex subunit G [Dorea longicatena]
MNKIVKNTLILTLITVIAGFLLGVVYEVTKTPISQAQETAKKEAWQAVFSDVKLGDFKAEDVDQKAADKAVKDMGVNATIDEVCTAGDAGYVITTTDKDGFGGNIQITVGIKKDGTINGVSILSISETAGLGMKATEPSFYNQYVNKQADKFVVSKDGGDGEQIDALSGATITSRAVTGAVNAALGYYQNAFK